MWATHAAARVRASERRMCSENWKQTESPVIKQFCRFSEDHDKEAITELTAACRFKCPRFFAGPPRARRETYYFTSASQRRPRRPFIFITALISKDFSSDKKNLNESVPATVRPPPERIAASLAFLRASSRHRRRGVISPARDPDYTDTDLRTRSLRV